MSTLAHLIGYCRKCIKIIPRSRTYTAVYKLFSFVLVKTSRNLHKLRISQCLWRDGINWKGQAKVEIIIPYTVVFQSNPFLFLSFQRKIDAVDITLSISFIYVYFSLNTYSGAGLKNCWIRTNNSNFSLSLLLFVSRHLNVWIMPKMCLRYAWKMP